jgi:hypothetical protein
MYPATAFGNATAIFPQRDPRAITFPVFLVTSGGIVGTSLDSPRCPNNSNDQLFSLAAYLRSKHRKSEYQQNERKSYSKQRKSLFRSHICAELPDLKQSVQLF